jgi:tRNA G18 (ribose-2'-O)-methylase SpoU
VAPQIHFITDAQLDDERLLYYRDLQDRRLADQSGRFVAESELVVRKLLQSPVKTESVLVTAPRLATLEPLLSTLSAEFPVYVVPQAMMDQVAGFHVHRGCLAIARRPERAIPDDARLVGVCVDLVDVDNVGAMARNAAAFGVDALVLSPKCADPFYRKAVRTSAGAVLTLPIVRASSWPSELLDLRQRGFTLLGAALSPKAVPLTQFPRPPRTAVLFGSEGPGLDEHTMNFCDALVTIPMAPSPAVDSLNVATAAAVVFFHLTQA